MKDFKIKILVILAVLYYISIMLALVLNNSVGWSIMGICMFSFLYYVVGLLFHLVSPKEFFKTLFKKAGNNIKKPKFHGYLFAGVMVIVGLFWLVYYTFAWFIYYV